MWVKLIRFFLILLVLSENNYIHTQFCLLILLWKYFWLLFQVRLYILCCWKLKHVLLLLKSHKHRNTICYSNVNFIDYEIDNNNNRNNFIVLYPLMKVNVWIKTAGMRIFQIWRLNQRLNTIYLPRCFHSKFVYSSTNSSSIAIQSFQTPL